MATVVQINKFTNFKFLLIPFIHDPGNEEELEQKCLIGVRYATGFTKVHGGLSEFVFVKEEADYATMRDRARTVLRLLNYVLDNNLKYQLSSLCDLDIWHGTDYLNWLTSKKVTQKYWYKEEEIINKFYYFLANRKLLNKFKLSDFTYIKIGNHRKKVLKSLFTNARRPKKRGANPLLLKNIDKELLETFFNVALRYTPRIALGVYFQVFGGFRRSEAVAANRAGISYIGSFGARGMIVQISDHIYRPDLRNVAGSGVKVPRQQKVEPVGGGLLPYLYETHLKKYATTDGTNALFALKNGKAMTPAMYSYYFKKFKHAFIKILKTSKNTQWNEYGIMLDSRKWDTHIGRGIFSNLKAEILQNSLMLMIDRGDTNRRSAQVYIQSTPQKVKERTGALDDMYMDKSFFREE